MRKKKQSRCIAVLVLLAMLSSAALSIPVSAATFPFTDVPTSHAYYKEIKYVYDNGIMNGTSATKFSPAENMNRAMVVTILYRMSGSTMKRAPSGFTDVPSSAYYYYAVGWAQHYGITTGATSTKFEPETLITREQMMSFLYRYATSYKGYSYRLVDSLRASRLSDYASITSYARPAINWALNSTILPPTAATVYPHTYVDRGVAAVYIYRLLTYILGSGKSFAMTSLSISESYNIKNIMGSMGYTTCLGYDLSPQAMEFAFYNSKMLYTHSHGNNTLIALSGGRLYADNIDAGQMQDMRLVYISACKAGNGFCKALYEKGKAKAVVGFRENVSASSDYDGIHYFNRRVFEHMKVGEDVYKAVKLARNDVVAAYGDESCGSDEVIVYPQS